MRIASKNFNLIFADGRREYKAGEEIEEAHADHWYALENSMAIGEQAEAEAESEAEGEQDEAEKPKGKPGRKPKAEQE